MSEQNMQKCEKCDGTGYHCPSCNGTGIIHVPIPFTGQKEGRPCPQCSEEKKIRKCVLCDGTGINRVPIQGTGGTFEWENQPCPCKTHKAYTPSGPLTMDEYQREAFKTAKETAKSPAYVALGLDSEIVELKKCVDGMVDHQGEIAGVVKKIIRDGIDPLKAESLRKELGDVLWYVSSMCSVNEWSLEKIARENLSKLKDRQARGVIGGSGDNR